MRTVLVAVDFSDTSPDVVRYGRELARAFNARIHLLHVLPDPLQQPWAVEAPGLDFPGLTEQWRVEAHERLTALAEASPEETSQTVIAARTGVPHRAIADYATEHGADLIVLGSHGHSPVVQFLIGGVTERVLRQATCPVLVVPHRARRQPRGDTSSAAAPSAGT